MTPEQEADVILSLAEGDRLRALELVERQLNILHGRAQVLLSLAGVVVTVTGFSGRTIAGTSSLSRILVITGLGVVLLSAIWLYSKVMKIKWVTGEVGEEITASIAAILLRRNAKTRAYTVGGIILCIGITIYCAAVALMLLAPTG